MNEAVKKNEKEICIKAGATAGSIVRCLIDSVKKTGKAGESVVEATGTLAKATSKECKTLCSKVDNFCKRIGYGGKVAGWESKQKEVFMKIGEKIFDEKELKHTASSSDILEEKEIKELLKNARIYEEEIQKLKDEIALQKQKMDTLAIIKRAEEDIERDDPRIRRVAVRVLERIGTRDVIPLITKALADPDSEVRQRAAEVMHRLADKFKVKVPEDVKSSGTVKNQPKPSSSADGNTAKVNIKVKTTEINKVKKQDKPSEGNQSSGK